MEVQGSIDPKPDSFFRRHRPKFFILVAAGILALIVVSPILLVFDPGFTFIDRLKERIHRHSFDAATWKNSLSPSSGADPIRLRMVDDLLRRHKLIGMTRDELVALIGTPPQTDYFRDYQFVYWLGPERSYFGIDSEWLAIRFDDDNRVSEALIVRD